MSGNTRGIAVASLLAWVLWLSSPGALLPASAQGGAQTPAPRPASQPVPAARPQGQPATPNGFAPAKATAAADVQYPLQTTADGIVVFDVSVGAQGEPKKIAVLQDLPPFTAAAEQSLHNWKFSPAAQGNQAEDSDMLVAFVFRHAVYIANTPAFTPVFPPKESGARAGFTAPAILYVAYAGYPPSTIAQGAVVLQASVNADGSIGPVDVLRDMGDGFMPLAMDAAKQWRFQPALRAGRNVPSKVAIAFVFSSRAMNPF